MTPETFASGTHRIAVTLKHLSSTSFQAWQTPKHLAAAFRVEYDLVLDAAASQDNAICPVFFDGTEGSDGLLCPWTAPGAGVWVNPPYEDVGPWIAKAFKEVYETRNCDRVVLLVPAAVGVSWFTGACLKAEVHLFDERIKFELPPAESLPAELRVKLYHPNGKPKVSPGGGNALIIIERDGLVGITALRSTKTGRMIMDFLDGQVYGEE